MDKLEPKRCIRCRTPNALMWWKCCPEHTTEQGRDVVCDLCVMYLHPQGV